MTKLTNPFPGLRPFQAHEANLFFGRERHIAEIIRKLDNFRFVSVVGNSGSGKSSLVRAGVLPTLSMNDDAWKICTMRPGQNPVSELVSSLREGGVVKSEASESDYNTLRTKRLGLVQMLRPHVGENDKILIVVDQFEELFRFHSIYEEEKEFNIAQHFVDLLLGATEQKDVPIYVMMTVRSDFLGDCEQFMGLPEAINDGQFLIPRMNSEELQSSLVGPIRVAGGKISPRLVQELSSKSGNNPDQLPILQHALMRTWEVWEDEEQFNQPMDVAHYEKTGGMDKALSNHAEEAFAELKNDKQRELAMILFKTVTVKGQDNRGVRRPTPVKTIAEISGATVQEVIEVASVFRRADRGFVMPPASVQLDEKSILDISHESLMRVWDRLSGWVQDEADAAALYTRITESALLYEEEKAGLWRDPDLAIAVDWRSKRQPNQAWAKQYNDHFNSAMRFVEASEQDKVFALAEASRRRKFTRAALIAFLVMLSILSLWALTERNNSLKNAKAAIAEKLEADKQKKIAEQQEEKALENYEKAKEEEKKAQQQTKETERQRELALMSAEEARQAKSRAEAESKIAVAAKTIADQARQNAEEQKSISDSLRYKSESAEKKATQLRMLALSQNLAIKARLADERTIGKELKALMALQAYNFNQKYGGGGMDVEIFNSLFSSVRTFQKKSDYQHNYHKDAVNAVCYNANTHELASTGDDGVVVITNGNSHSNPRRSKLDDLRLFDNLVYSDNGTQIAASCDNHSLYIFNGADLSKPSQVIEGVHSSEIIAIEWFNNRVITACLDKKIRVIDLNKGKVVKVINSFSKPLCLDFDINSGKLFMGSDNGVVYSMNVNVDTAFSHFRDLKSGRINALSINSRKNWLAVGTSKGDCKIISSIDGTTLKSLNGHQSGLTHVRFNPKSDLLATSSMDYGVRLYDLNDPGGRAVKFNEHDSWAMDVVFSSNGRMLASCSRDKTVRTYPANLEDMVEMLKSNLQRNMTEEEWDINVGEDIEYEKTLTDL